MAFYCDYFVFDNVSSERHNLKITTPKSDETINISEYKSDLIKTPRRNKFYSTKPKVEEPLMLAVSIFSETPLTRSQMDNIDRWLFRTDGKFRKLRINQPDMQGYYYNCKLQKLSISTFGNKPYQVDVIMECDSQYAWQNQLTRDYNITSTPYVAKFVNTSSEDLMSPIYEITCNPINMSLMSTDRTIKIVNEQYEDDRLNVMEFVNIFDNEILHIDTETGIITSNMRTSGVLDLFVYPNFMKLKRGNHNFEITGDISKFSITFVNARKIGN
jgi:hypothetical protein